MASIEILSAKIVKKDQCSYTYEESSPSGFRAVTVDDGNIIHDDMRYAFRQLVPHLAFICEEVEDSTDLGKAIDDMQTLSESLAIHKRLQKYRVTSMKLTGSADTQGIVLTGVKKLESGKTITLNSPNIRWKDEYQYINELRVAVEKVKAEVIFYSEGKIAPEDQLELFPEGTGLEDDPDEAI